MKISLTTSLLLALVTGFAEAAPDRELSWAEKMFSELEYDFGVVTYGADARHEIAIHNNYKSTITIHGVKSTCGCTTPSVTANSIASGETAHLVLQLNTTRFKKGKAPHVDVQISHDGGRSIETVRVAVRAYIRDDVTVADEVLDLGVVTAGASTSRTTTVTYQGSAPWKITGAKSSGAQLDVRVGQPTRTNRGLTYDITVTLDPSVPVGKFDRQIFLTTEEPAQSYFPLQVRATIEPDVVVATPVVQLGTLGPGEPRSSRIVLRGRNPFAVESMDGGEACNAADMDPAALKKVHILPFTFTAPSAPGHFSEAVSIEITGDHPAVSFRVEGDVTVPEAPAIVAGEPAL
jgi:hypothetical protein